MRRLRTIAVYGALSYARTGCLDTTISEADSMGLRAITINATDIGPRASDSAALTIHRAFKVILLGAVATS